MVAEAGRFCRFLLAFRRVPTASQALSGRGGRTSARAAISSPGHAPDRPAL